jgi:hypothetical protein
MNKWIHRIRLTGADRIGRFLLAFIAAMAILHSPHRAIAGPPFITDDPEPVEKGHGEFYIASETFWTRDGVSGTLPHFEFNYGPFDDVQLHLITPMAYDRPKDTGSFQYGYGDTELGIKYRFIHEDSLFKGCPQVGIFPLAEMPSGDQFRGLGNGRAQAFLPVWLQKSWGEENRRWTVYGGGGMWLNPGPGNKNYGFMGVVFQKQITDNLTLGSEFFHSTKSADDQSDHTGFNLGGVYDFSERWHFLFSIGRDFKGDSLLINYVAIQLTF